MNTVATGDTIAAADHNIIVQTLTGVNGQLLTTTAKGANIASAATLTLGTDGNYFQVTGTTGITAISTAPAGTEVVLEFQGACLLTHNGTSLILQGATNYTTAAGDVFEFISEGSGNWREVGRNYGTAAAKYATALCTGDVTMTNANQYYDATGATVTLGAGVWLVTGKAELNCTANTGYGLVKLWDGTTVYAVGETIMTAVGAGQNWSIPVGSAVVTLTASATLKISCASGGAANTIKKGAPNALAGGGETTTATSITAMRLF